MKAYIETAKVLFKSQLAYRFDTLLSMVFTVSKIILAYVLWGAIFESRELVAGFTFHSMISYYIISSFISQLDQSSGTGRQISDEIRDGLFSKYMVRPINIFCYFSAQTAGVSAYLLGFNLLAALVWVVIFRIQLVITGELALLLAALGLLLLGLIFMMQLNFYIGILAFKFLETGVFMMIKDNILQFVTGTLIPLTIIPAPIVAVMQYFPFYYVTYLPTMLALGRKQEEILLGVIVLVAWNLAMALINTWTWQRLRTKYDGVGI